MPRGALRIWMSLSKKRPDEMKGGMVALFDRHRSRDLEKGAGFGLPSLLGPESKKGPQPWSWSPMR